MKKKLIAVITGAMVLCMAAAGCASQENNTTNEAAETAVTEEAAVAATEAVAEEVEDMSWQEEDDAYLTGVTAEDYIELPEDYKHQTVEAAKPVDPTDDEVEDRIDTELQNRTSLEEVDRKVKEGDTVNIDFVGKLNGEAFEGGTGNYDLEIGSHTFIEGFEDGLIGAKKGETRDLNLTFPENYGEASLAGQDVVFTVTVNTISETVVPKLTDDFVKSLNLTNAFGQAVTSVEDYKDYIRSNMIEEREATYEDTVKNGIVKVLMQNSSFKQDPPENMVERYNYLLTRQLNYYALQSYTDLKTLMTYYYGATEDNYLDMIREMAKSYAKQGLVFQAVADNKELNPDEDAISTAIAEYVASDPTTESVEDLDRVIRESLRDELMTDNVIDYLYEHCRIEEPEEVETSEDADAADTSDEAAAADTGETAAAAEEEEKDSEEEKEASDKSEKEESEKESEEKDSDKDSDKDSSEEKDKEEDEKDKKD